MRIPLWTAFLAATAYTITLLVIGHHYGIPTGITAIATIGGSAIIGHLISITHRRRDDDQ